jgi:hypothetical protein
MSLRDRAVQRLASLLTSKSGATVRVFYDRQVRRYRVVWTNGPDTAQMYTLAVRFLPEVSKVDPSTLLWDRSVSGRRTRPAAAPQV